MKALPGILRSTALSDKEIAKTIKNPNPKKLWVVKWSSRNEGFENKKKRGKTKVMNEAAKTNFKEG